MLVEEMLWLQNKPEDNGVMKPDSCVVFFQALHSVTLGKCPNLSKQH